MGVKTQNGFTFIEVMLFLAVTGLLAMAILAGSGMAINQQRYRDSVNTLKSDIQQQYSEVISVINARGENWECDGNGVITDTGGPSGEARGRSDCVMLGRFITIDNTGKNLVSSSVSAYRVAGAVAPSDLQEIAANYRLAISPINQEQDEISWGAQVVKQKLTTPMPLSILIIRSPLSGSIMTFTADNVQTNLNAMVTAGNMSTVRNLCVNPDATSFLGSKRLEVRLEAYASGQSAVSIPPESASVCD